MILPALFSRAGQLLKLVIAEAARTPSFMSSNRFLRLSMSEVNNLCLVSSTWQFCWPRVLALCKVSPSSTSTPQTLLKYGPGLKYHYTTWLLIFWCQSYDNDKLYDSNRLFYGVLNVLIQKIPFVHVHKIKIKNFIVILWLKWKEYATSNLTTQTWELGSSELNVTWKKYQVTYTVL